MTIHFETLGCKLNQIESESAAKAFYDQGYIISSKNLTRASGTQKDIGLAIINTCTVTGKAEQKARRLINMLLDLCPDAPIIVTGCYAELDGAYLEEIDNRVIILPGSKKGYLTDKNKGGRKPCLSIIYRCLFFAFTGFSQNSRWLQ
jgi:threonylcarbamoyladenosine tRNA methylthiotransferase MtaB